jgi:F0F1-type ATP synthase alpha subunit
MGDTQSCLRDAVERREKKKNLNFICERAAVKGYLDQILISNIDQYEDELLKYMDPSILSTILQQKNITEHINNQLATFCQKFTQGFLATHSVRRD